MDFSFVMSDGVMFVILRILIVFVLTASVAKLALFLIIRRRELNLHLRILRKLVIVLSAIVGVVLALEQLPGLENTFATILAGSGIAALGISLAAQESLGNVISGVSISASKPFEIGDRINMLNGNITGNIEDITLRHTVVRTFMNSRIIIPNSVINKEMIENSNIVEERASNFLDVTITYDSDMEAAMRIMAKVVAGHPNYIDVRPPEALEQPIVPVFVRALGVFGVELRCSVWTGSIANNFSTCSEVRHQLKLEYDKAGIKFATRALAEPPG